MAWVKMPGLNGKVYVPDNTVQIPKKHPCTGCFSCQWCDDNRCQVCRSGDSITGKPDSPRCCANPLSRSAEKKDS